MNQILAQPHLEFLFIKNLKFTLSNKQISKIEVDDTYSQEKFGQSDFELMPGCKQIVVNKLKSELIEKEMNVPTTGQKLSQILFDNNVFDGNPEVWELVLKNKDFVRKI